MLKIRIIQGIGRLIYFELFQTLTFFLEGLARRLCRRFHNPQLGQEESSFTGWCFERALVSDLLRRPGDRTLQEDDRPDEGRGAGQLHDDGWVDADLRCALLRGVRQAAEPVVARTQLSWHRAVQSQRQKNSRYDIKLKRRNYIV